MSNPGSCRGINAHLSNHVIDEAMLVPDPKLLKLLLIVLLVDLLEDHEELAIILLEDGVLRGQVQWPAAAIAISYSATIILEASHTYTAI